jgi:hypothetical protein
MTENWDPDLRDLANEYSPGYVITAFAVKDHLEEEGYPGIHFTDTTESYLKQIGPPIIKAKVEKHMQRQLDKQT